MPRTRMQTDPQLAIALGEPDAWEGPRWPDHETHSSDYERAIASLSEPGLDIPADRTGRPHRALMAHRNGADRVSAERRDDDRRAGGGFDHSTFDRSIMDLATAEQTASTYRAHRRHHDAFADGADAEEDDQAALRSDRAANPARYAEPAGETTLADFRTLARTIEQMRKQSPENAAGPIVAARARKTWLDDVRASHDTRAAIEPSPAPDPWPSGTARSTMGASGDGIPAPAVVDEPLARSLDALMRDVATLAHKADVARLEASLVEVVRRITVLESDLREETSVRQETQARLETLLREAARRDEPAAPPHARPRLDPVSTRQTIASPESQPAPPPRRLTVEGIEARIAERRQAAEAAKRATALPQPSPASTRAIEPPQTRDVPAVAYEPRQRVAPRRLFT